MIVCRCLPLFKLVEKPPGYLSKMHKNSQAVNEPFDEALSMNWAKFLRRMSLTAIFALAVYIGMFTIYEMFPYVRVGSKIVNDEKLRFIERESLFPPDAKHRLVIFGDSKVLAGFIPALFDELSGDGIYSYNLGIPEVDIQPVISVLQNIIGKGHIPTDIFITIPWNSLPEKNPLIFFDNDNEIIKKLVPFRYLFRDLAVFVRRSQYRGGIINLYNESRRSAREVLENRGYFFIAGQSFYENDELPEDFSFSSDQPDRLFPRKVPPKNELYEQFVQLLESHSINAYFVPVYYRIGEYRPNPLPNEELIEMFKDNPHIHVLGPDYFSFPNKLFSDPTHLNRNGAEIYTAKLWELYDKHIQERSSQH